MKKLIQINLTPEEANHVAGILNEWHDNAEEKSERTELARYLFLQIKEQLPEPKPNLTVIDSRNFNQNRFDL